MASNDSIQRQRKKKEKKTFSVRIKLPNACKSSGMMNQSNCSLSSENLSLMNQQPRHFRPYALGVMAFHYKPNFLLDISLQSTYFYEKYPQFLHRENRKLNYGKLARFPQTHLPPENLPKMKLLEIILQFVVDNLDDVLVQLTTLERMKDSGSKNNNEEKVKFYSKISKSFASLTSVQQSFISDKRMSTENLHKSNYLHHLTKYISTSYKSPATFSAIITNIVRQHAKLFLNLTNYKIVVLVTTTSGEQKRTILFASKCLWDRDTDRFVSKNHYFKSIGLQTSIVVYLVYHD
ncbi:hypothetical protein SNEBB_002361 [Seison nebaliae]|nr:hypothetical protein SNEBB_002361 [Seison nebaliae]